MCHFGHIFFKNKCIWNVTGIKIDKKTVILHEFILCIKTPHVNIVDHLHVNQKGYFDMRNKHVVYKVNCTMQYFIVLCVFLISGYQICKFWKFDPCGFHQRSCYCVILVNCPIRTDVVCIRME
jgi:hypothetical protein